MTSCFYKKKFGQQRTFRFPDKNLLAKPRSISKVVNINCVVMESGNFFTDHFVSVPSNPPDVVVVDSPETVGRPSFLFSHFGRNE
jgi:hypothetical protein